jgi:methylenetetrahydrofolate reductase (NADPH)
MKISAMFGGEKPVVSFEVFPPKPDLPLETVFATLEELRGLKPAFISVTYGAGGSNSSRSIEIVDKVKNGYGVETVAHLTCVGADRQTIDAVLDRLQGLQIENILALRGDPPTGQDAAVSPDSRFCYAKDLIAHIRRRNFFSIAAAAYPEGHLECRDLDQDIEYLAQKVDQGVDLLVTQLFFDNSFFYTFRDKLAARGIGCPLSAGIMPVLSASQIKRITSLCGSAVPDELARIMARYGAVPAEMEKAGLDYACRQMRDLLDNKVDGIHLYTMNKARQTRTIMDNLGLL